MEYILKWCSNDTLSFGEGRGEANISGCSGNLIDTLGPTSPVITTCYNSIVGGQNNTICAVSCYSFIGGGGGDPATSTFTGNQVIGNFGFIGGGSTNYIGATATGTTSAYPSNYGVIAGGLLNCIDSGNTPATFSTYGVIGGGQNNKICAGTCFNSILGGVKNTNSGNYSAILGGQGNTVTHNWASASGYNLTSAFDCAFHANQVVAPGSKLYATAGASLMQYVPVTIGMAAIGFPLGGCVVVM